MLKFKKDTIILTSFVIYFTLFLSCPINTKACRVYLTISLYGKTVNDSNLEVNWGPYCRNLPEWIGVYRDDPSISYGQPEVVYRDLVNSSGRIETNIKIGNIRFPSGWNRNDENIVPADYPKGKCLSYYVASFNDTELLTVECLKIKPNWMTKLEKHIGWIPLKDLFIPGSHASGAYYNSSIKHKSLLIRDYASAQHFDVWSQLMFGIRFLDLSIGYVLSNTNDPSGKDNFWIANEHEFVNPLHYILKDVRRFVKLSQEVVILDFSSFPLGFYKRPDLHGDLYRIIREEIGDLAYQRVPDEKGNLPNCYELTVNNITSTGKYILIIYPLEELPYPENESNILCPIWKRFTTSFMNTSQTLDYMRLLFSKRPPSITQEEGWIFHAVSGMEQSLVKKSSFIRNSNNKLLPSRERASTINPKISNWLYGPWSTTANVVTLDYFTNTDIIDIAINANLIKAYQTRFNGLLYFDLSRKKRLAEKQ